MMLRPAIHLRPAWWLAIGAVLALLPAPCLADGEADERAALELARAQRQPLDLDDARRWRWLLWTLRELGEQSLEPDTLADALGPFADDPALGQIAARMDLATQRTMDLEPIARRAASQPRDYAAFDASPMPAAASSAPARGTTATGGGYRPFGADEPTRVSTSSPARTRRSFETRYEPFDAVVREVPASPPVPARKRAAAERYLPFDAFVRYDDESAPLACESDWSVLANAELARGCRDAGGTSASVELDVQMLLHPSRRTLRDVELTVRGSRRWTLPTGSPVAVARVAYLDGASPAFEITAVPESLSPFGEVAEMERVLVVASKGAAAGRALLLELVDAACVAGLSCSAYAIDLPATNEHDEVTLGVVHLQPAHGKDRALWPGPWQFQIARGVR